MVGTLSAMLSRKVIVFLSAVAPLFLPVCAQDVLTWEDCFARAVSNNLNLSIGRIRLEEAEAALKSQRSVFLPDVSASGSYGTSGAKNKGDSDWSSRDSTSVRLNASYVLFDGFGNRARVSRSEAELYAVWR